MSNRFCLFREKYQSTIAIYMYMYIFVLCFAMKERMTEVCNVAFLTFNDIIESERAIYNSMCRTLASVMNCPTLAKGSK